MLNNVLSKTLLKINNDNQIKKIIFNINWITLEKLIKLVLGVFVTAWVARYLGPTSFGKLNYSISFVSLFAFISTLGLEQIAIRELVKTENKEDVMGSVFLLRLFGSIILNLVILLTLYLFDVKSPQIKFFIIIVTLGYLFKPFEVIKYWFYSQVQAKYISLSLIISLVIVSVMRVILIVVKASLFSFVIMISVSFLLESICLVFFYRLKLKTSVFDWKVNKKVIKKMLNDSLPLIFSSAAVAVHMKIDHVMVGNMLGDHSVGLYSAATRLKQWGFVAFAISNTFYPYLVKAKEVGEKYYKNKLQNLFDMIIMFALLIIFSVVFLSDYIILFLYGTEYLLSSLILKILVIEAIFNFVGIVISKHIIIENITKIQLYRTLIGVTCNIVLNYILISACGVIGAPIATLLSVSIQAYFSVIFFKETRFLIYMPLKTFNLLRFIR
ncbi:MAG: flippase [Clostridiales bacterium]|nr:flippase [Clostridiales bacterium]MCF8023164.1 flippase [Clostridiales bacterium]